MKNVCVVCRVENSRPASRDSCFLGEASFLFLIPASFTSFTLVIFKVDSDDKSGREIMSSAVCVVPTDSKFRDVLRYIYGWFLLPSSYVFFKFLRLKFLVLVSLGGKIIISSDIWGLMAARVHLICVSWGCLVWLPLVTFHPSLSSPC